MSQLCVCIGIPNTSPPIEPPNPCVSECLVIPHMYIPNTVDVMPCGAEVTVQWPEDCYDIDVCTGDPVFKLISKSDSIATVTFHKDNGITFTTTDDSAKALIEIIFKVCCNGCDQFSAYGSLIGVVHDPCCDDCTECAEGEGCNGCTGDCEALGADLSLDTNYTVGETDLSLSV